MPKRNKNHHATKNPRPQTNQVREKLETRVERASKTGLQIDRLRDEGRTVHFVFINDANVQQVDAHMQCIIPTPYEAQLSQIGTIELADTNALITLQTKGNLMHILSIKRLSYGTFNLLKFLETMLFVAKEKHWAQLSIDATNYIIVTPIKKPGPPPKLEPGQNWWSQNNDEIWEEKWSPSSKIVSDVIYVMGGSWLKVLTHQYKQYGFTPSKHCIFVHPFPVLIVDKDNNIHTGRKNKRMSKASLEEPLLFQDTESSSSSAPHVEEEEEEELIKSINNPIWTSMQLEQQRKKQQAAAAVTAAPYPWENQGEHFDQLYEATEVVDISDDNEEDNDDEVLVPSWNPEVSQIPAKELYELDPIENVSSVDDNEFQRAEDALIQNMSKIRPTTVYSSQQSVAPTLRIEDVGPREEAVHVTSLGPLAATEVPVASLVDPLLPITSLGPLANHTTVVESAFIDPNDYTPIGDLPVTIMAPRRKTIEEQMDEYRKEARRKLQQSGWCPASSVAAARVEPDAEQYIRSFRPDAETMISSSSNSSVEEIVTIIPPSTRWQTYESEEEPCCCLAGIEGECHGKNLVYPFKCFDQGCMPHAMCMMCLGTMLDSNELDVDGTVIATKCPICRAYPDENAADVIEEALKMIQSKSDVQFVREKSALEVLLTDMLPYHLQEVLVQAATVFYNDQERVPVPDTFTAKQRRLYMYLMQLKQQGNVFPVVLSTIGETYARISERDAIHFETETVPAVKQMVDLLQHNIHDKNRIRREKRPRAAVVEEPRQRAALPQMHLRQIRERGTNRQTAAEQKVAELERKLEQARREAEADKMRQDPSHIGHFIAARNRRAQLLPGAAPHPLSLDVPSSHRPDIPRPTKRQRLEPSLSSSSEWSMSTDAKEDQS